ncbi:MAG: PUA domain-containing protein [Thermoprotei archaeon]
MIFKDNLLPPEPLNNFDYTVLKKIAEYQFFSRAVSDCLFPSPENFLVQRSSTTGKIRNVLTKVGKLYLVLRAQDLLFSLNWESASVIKSCTKRPELRVIIPSEVRGFVMEGKNVFAKFVLDVDFRLRSGDEVLVVTEEDELVAIGRMRLSGEEVKQYKRGVAVNVRRGAKDFD